MLRIVQFITGLVLLMGIEITRIYFSDSAGELPKYLLSNIFYFRIVGILIILFPIIHFYWLGSMRSKVIVSLSLALYLVVTMIS